MLYLGADHAGFGLKQKLRVWLTLQGIAWHDVGTTTIEPVDYPDIAGKVCNEVRKSSINRGILICGTGIGMCMAANRHKKIRAYTPCDARAATLGRRHNDANVLCLPGRPGNLPLAKRLIMIFLNAKFDAGRHVRRIKKME